MTPEIRILAVFLTLAFLVFIVRLVRSRRLRAKYSFLWLGISAVTIVFAAVPQLMEQISLGVGILYPPALLFLGAITFLLFLAVHFSWELSRLEDRTRTLAEELALASSRIEELESGSRSDDHAGRSLRIESISR